ncbi:methyl-accepting chemotaxis protein [Qipengyuania sphaerica]|uniref:methyl-accepting chemotaxis protein n=1 Tax=Qipengyuania sphaerica TaxID=2867243 RepID=UPI001C878C47|nr:HAMP domain-containing methyl-accepting chemotaxis protein [Qipengyuania sphaerica]MBX7540198.1 methyl-accepting chemotaxis protein [Qipengyuania sphaerica]
MGVHQEFPVLGDTEHTVADGSQGAPLRLWLRDPKKAFRQTSLTIAGQINLFAGVAVAILMGLAVILGAGLLQLSVRTDESAVLADRTLAASQLNSGIVESRYHASRYAVTGETASIDAAFTALADARERLDQSIETDVSEATSQERIEWLRGQVTAFEPELNALRNSVEAYGPNEGAMALAAAIDVSGTLLTDQIAGIEAEFSAANAIAKDDLESLKLWTALAALLLIVSCAVLVVLAARRMSSQVSRSLSRITGAMTALANGDSSIAIPGVSRQDEIGEMSRALVVFRESAEALTELQRKAHADQQALLLRLSTGFEQGMGDVVTNVAAASGQLETTASRMASAASQSSGFVEEVARRMEDTSVSVTSAAAATDQFALSISEIGKQAGQSASLAQEARSSAESADVLMQRLSHSADEVGAVVELIASIADRTNLLALNASIEAARGGEAGRGFAVVASEVKELARQTREATESVADKIASMQGSTKGSADALAAIGERIREVEITATAIAQAVDEQSLSSQELAKNLDTAAMGVSDIGSSIEQIREMALETGSSADQLLASASGLKGDAKSLDNNAKEFVASITAA